MNRRHFLGQFVLGSAALSAISSRVSAVGQSGTLKVKFVGMMGYITRSDQSMLVAMPGHHPMGLYPHVPFLMARTGSAIATALGLTPMPAVVAGAFDDRLANEPSGAFAFRCLEGCDLEIHAGGSAVDNQATHLAQMTQILPGKRLRNDVRRWSTAIVTLRGGRLDNSAAHPDAGKIWSFGSHQQPLTDATLYTATGGSLQLSAATHVSTFVPSADEVAELWVVSSAGPRTDIADPKRLVHSEVLFQFLAQADPVIPTCAEAEGRITLATELPCSPSHSASSVARLPVAMPPYVDLCIGGQMA